VRAGVGKRAIRTAGASVERLNFSATWNPSEVKDIAVRASKREILLRGKPKQAESGFFSHFP
jgi:hypothetical protein